ncbi:MAG: hypothetical protein HUU38_26530, partial [Anaerolineales bacterium]|nr:hypothetical protein [Anaerolineales bacterium]
MRKFRSVLTWLVLSVVLAACSTVVNACGGAQADGQVSALASLDSVFIVRADASRENLPVEQTTVLSVGEGVDVDEAGRAILQFGDLLTVEVLRDGELTVQEVSLDEQNAAVTIFQNGGLLLNDFDPAEAIAKRFTITTEFATIEATGTTFMVYQEPNSPLQWVLALDATPNDLEVTTGTGVTKDVQTNIARWIAPIGDASAGIPANMSNVQTWLAQSQAGTNTDNFGDIVWPQADVLADSQQVLQAAPQVVPAPGASYTYQNVGITLGAAGQYAAEDCNLDGIPDVAMVNGSLEMDFRQVLARVKALDVTVLVRNGSATLTVLDPARGTIDAQSAPATPESAQILTLRHDVPYHYAQLEMTDGCFLGFSLTPPQANELPEGPRTPIENMEVPESFVRIEVPAADGIVTTPLIISGVASVPENNDRQLLVKLETPDGQEIQRQWVHVEGGEIGGEAGTFYTTMEVDYILPAEVVVRVQNIQPTEFPIVLAEDWVPITLNPEKTGAFRRPPEYGEFYAPFISESIGTNSIVMDGDGTDWQVASRSSGVNPTSIGRVVYDEACEVFNPYGVPSLEASVDLAAQVMFAFDTNYLYVLYLVQDESFVPYRGEDTRLFLGDAPQLIIDTDLAGDFEDTTDSKDDLEFDFHPGFVESSGDDVGAFYFLYAPRAAYWNLGEVGTLGLQASRRADEVIMATWWTSDGYGIEAAIPWASLNYSGVPGGSFGVAASVSD